MSELVNNPTAGGAPPASAPVHAGKPAEFFIPAAVSLLERRPRTLKHGDTFAVFDHNGDALPAAGNAEGIYHRDTRHISYYWLTFDGAGPMLLSSALRDDNATLTCDLTNPDLFADGGNIVLEHDLVHIRRSRFVWSAACFERLVVMNFDDIPHRVRIAINFASDFADIFEVRGSRRDRRGTLHPPQISADSVLLAYTGLDGMERRTSLRFEPAPSLLTADRAIFEFDLAPRTPQPIFIEIRCNPQETFGAVLRSFFVALRDARRALRAVSSRAASVATSNTTFNEAARRSVSDLYMLVTDKPEGPYPYAGIPWFSTVFGRDALITALETLWLDPALACGVLGYLANNQARAVDPEADAEPGKILHEVRHGEMAVLGEVPFARYYGSIDSTPLFVMLAGAYLDRTGDLDMMRKIWPNIEAALDWIDRDGDRDHDGFVEYGRRTATGLKNQGWKDSHDSIFHSDGTLAKGPIALAEVQAYVYGAWRAASSIARRLEKSERAATLEAKAEALRKHFDEMFYDDMLGTYVLALDGDKRPCRVRASNAGHALFTGIAYPERAPAVVATLMDTSSFSGWGVRTVASTEARYNPMSYHNGSVWPHDNAMIGAGFARYGFRREAARIFGGLFAASAYVDLNRLPELFCGFPRQRNIGPTFYPVACLPQAWAAAAPFSLIQSCFGLGFDLTARQVIFEQPVLPDFLDEVVLRRISMAGGSIDVALRRTGTEVVVQILSRKGGLQVVTRN